MKFGQLILRKIIKFVVARCQILRLKCTKISFIWAPPQSHLGELDIRWPTSKGRNKGGVGRKWRGKGREIPCPGLRK